MSLTLQKITKNTAVLLWRSPKTTIIYIDYGGHCTRHNEIFYGVCVSLCSGFKRHNLAQKNPMYITSVLSAVFKFNVFQNVLNLHPQFHSPPTKTHATLTLICLRRMKLGVEI